MSKQPELTSIHTHTKKKVKKKKWEAKQEARRWGKQSPVRFGDWYGVLFFLLDTLCSPSPIDLLFYAIHPLSKTTTTAHFLLTKYSYDNQVVSYHQRVSCDMI